MYSDMSTWIIASSSPNRNSASVRASSVFPTPEGPRKMNEPVGRFGSLIPARARRIAFETATIAVSWPITRLCSSSSIRTSFCDSASVSLKTGIPVHIETMSAISSSPISGCSSSASLRQRSSSSFFFCVSFRSLSRSDGGLLELLGLDRRFLVGADGLDLLLELAVARRRGHRPDADARAGLVDQVDRLVGEVAVLDVAVGEHRRGAERVVGDLDAVVRLVAVAQAAQDLHGLVDRRLLDAHLLEPPLEGRIALEVLAVLVERRRADRLELTARERRLEDRGRVDRALGGARPDEIVELVDEQDDVAALGDLLHHLLQALLELAAVLRARDERGEVERVDLLVLQELGHLVRRDARSEALDDGGLADARLADQHRVVLLAAREDLHHALDLGLAADDRVELALGRLLRQVAAELVEELRVLRLLALGGAARLARLPATGAGEHADDLVADLLRVGVEVEQDPGGDALVLADEPEQDVLGADVVVAERERLAQRELEHLLRARRERDLAGRDLVALADDAGDLRAHLFHGDVQLLEHARGEALLLAQQPEQDVLGADVVVLQSACLVLGKDDDLSGPFCEALEHSCLDPPFRVIRSLRCRRLRVEGTPDRTRRVVQSPDPPECRTVRGR